jgi:hypothetical protein
MDARWTPLLAAVVGVLGAVGGALVGGAVANQGQEQGFERQRAAALQDLRRETYGDYIGTAQEIVASFVAGRPPPKVNAIWIRLFVAEGRVALVADNPDVEAAAADVRRSVEEHPHEPNKTAKQEAEEQLAEYEDAANQFLAVARDEIEKSGY